MVLVLLNMAVYLDFASAIDRYGKIEVNKHGIDNATKEEISSD
jgi:hypothetical protein